MLVAKRFRGFVEPEDIFLCHEGFRQAFQSDFKVQFAVWRDRGRDIPYWSGRSCLRLKVVGRPADALRAHQSLQRLGIASVSCSKKNGDCMSLRVFRSSGSVLKGKGKRGSLWREAHPQVVLRMMHKPEMLALGRIDMTVARHISLQTSHHDGYWEFAAGSKTASRQAMDRLAHLNMPEELGEEAQGLGMELAVFGNGSPTRKGSGRGIQLSAARSQRYSCE